MKTYIQIGCGGWGNFWLNRFIPQTADVARCVAAVDLNPAALENARQKIGLPKEKLYTDLRQALLENPVDYVVIAVSINAHLDVVKTVLEYGNGCAILSEKPIAGCMEDCAEIYRLVKAAGVKLAVTFSHRHEDDKQTFLGLMRSGETGRMNYLVSRIIIARTHNTGHKLNPPEMAFIDGGAHNIDMIRAFSGANAEEVYAKAWNTDWADGRGACSAFVHAKMENGVRAFLEYEFGGAHTYNGWCNEYFRAECDNGSYELDNRRITVHALDAQDNPVTRTVALPEDGHWSHDLLIRQFVGWLDGGPAPETTLEDSIHAMGMLYAIVESSRTGKPVRVRELMERNGLA